MRACATQPVADNAPQRKRAGYAQRACPIPVPVTGGALLQRAPRCACGGGCPRCRNKLPVQAKLAVSQPGDTYEQEADRVAEQVMRMPAPAPQKSCASCTAGGATCAKCADEEKRSLRRKAEPESGPSDSAGDTVLSDLGPGRPLDAAARNFFEPRFGHDFGRVRVHTGAQAAESARDVDALAYTVGRDLVFGAGQYAPQTSAGQKLLAHELTHAVQQSTAPATLQRACVTDPECKPPTPSALPGAGVKGSATHFTESVEKEVKEHAEKAKVKTPKEIRKELCDKVPPDPGCTADGHGRRAAAFEEMARANAPTQLALATGVFVDKDMPQDYGAYAWGCQYFTPKIEGDQCVFVPEHLETEAAAYNKGEKKIAGRDREDWLTQALSTATHELEHVRFTKEFPTTAPRPEACKFEDVSRELTELAAIMSEFPVFYRASAAKSWSARRSALNSWFEYKITKPSKHGERIAGILKAIRCRCECEDVNAYVKRVAEFTTASWTEDEKNTFHTQLRDPKWKLDWPIETPLPPRDVPSWLLTPSGGYGYSYLGSSGISASLGLDVGIPLDRLGEWQLLIGAQGRFLSGVTARESQFAYLLGLKVSFLRGPALGSSGFQYGAFGEIGGGSFESGANKETGAYAAGGVNLRYTPGLGGLGPVIPFIGVEVGGGARIDTTNPEVRKLFFAGLTVGGEF